jgi:hypothetical protein
MGKLFIGYILGISSYGFYRGYNNLYKKNSIFNYNTDLYTEKISSGLFSVCYHLNPVYHHSLLYYIFLRSEKKLRKIELTENDWEY